MRGQRGFFDVDERYARLSAVGDPLEKLNTNTAAAAMEDHVNWSTSVGARRLINDGCITASSDSHICGHFKNLRQNHIFRMARRCTRPDALTY